jgi:H/ACA ribonucleoprotein complex subunit 3
MKCSACGKYTLKGTCGVCGKSTVMALPPRYSPIDRFQKYRLKERL